MIVARVPIYGTKDAGRGFWRQLREDILATGLRENAIMKALYHMQVDGQVVFMLATHVDDMLWASAPGYEHIADRLLEKFSIKKVEEGTFRFCGREIRQTDDGSITVKCKDNAEKVQPITYEKRGRKDTDDATDSEISQLRSVIGSLSWVARQCRPDLSYRVSKLQSLCTRARLKDLSEANKVVRDAVTGSDIGLHYKAGEVDGDNLHSITVTDASHANEEVITKTSTEPHRSQQGRVFLLTSGNPRSDDELKVHVISYASTLIKRVCRATLQAEAYSLQGGIEEGLRIRAAIADMFDKLVLKDWERSAGQFMKHTWLTDCCSLRDHLLNPTFARCSDKRLSIDMAAMRQLIWLDDNDEPRDSLDETCSDMLRCIDTTAMIADCLTKAMKPRRLIDALRGHLDLRATPEGEQGEADGDHA